MLRIIPLIALLALGGCETYRVAAQVGAGEVRKDLDALGHLELRGPCLVRAGTIERLPEVKRVAVRAYTPVMCQTPE